MIQLPGKRFVIGVGFALAVAATPALGVLAGPPPHSPAPVAQPCPDGEEPDFFTAACVPFIVPAAATVRTAVPANPDVGSADTPGTGNVPCPVPNDCIGLSRVPDGASSVPRSDVGGTPTITGELGP